jgi:ferric-dicitrate binding protein FerR (iron transport regulator)
MRERAYATLREEWLDVTRQRRLHRMTATFAIAASIVLAIVFVPGLLKAPAPLPAGPLASILRVSGNGIKLNGTQFSMPLGDASLALEPGDRLDTGTGSRLAVSWNRTGSMRVNENSQLAILTAESVRLFHGSIYYDSLQFGQSGGEPAIMIVETPIGRVTHHGTQFLTTIDGDSVSVSVREGEVHIAGPSIDVAIEAGQVMTVAADGRWSRQSVTGYDERWHWAADVAPIVPLDGQAADDVLAWVARETGRVVTYRTDSAQRIAHKELKGIGTLGPQQALQAIPVMTSLKYRIADGRIIVDLTE